MALGKRTQQPAGEMSSDGKAKRLRAQEIDRTAGQKRRHGRTCVRDGMNQQEAKPCAQAQQEERHRSCGNAARDG
jgi:hypothetical protein